MRAFNTGQQMALLNAFGENLVIVQDGVSKTITAILEQDEIFFEETQSTVNYFSAASGEVSLHSTFILNGITFQVNRIDDDLSGISNYHYIEKINLDRDI